MHLGVDVGILTALDVRAATSGTVTASGWITGYEGYGNVVPIDQFPYSKEGRTPPIE